MRSIPLSARTRLAQRIENPSPAARHARTADTISMPEVRQWRARGAAGTDERRGRLRRHHGLDQIRLLIRDEPSEGAAGRVRHQDARADAIDELAAAHLPERLRQLRVARRRVRRRDELIDERITDVAAGAGPLLVRGSRRGDRVARQQIVA